jgi:hypothetical protein
MTGAAGLMSGTIELLLVTHWVAPSARMAARLYQLRMLLNGFALGLIMALILSHELLGRKVPKNESTSK